MEVIKIIVCGDFRAAHPEKICFSEEVQNILADSDLKICNFEVPVRVDGAKPIKKSGPSVDQSIASPAFLEQNDFNVILLANNHIMDYGEEGLFATLRSFKKAITVGAGSAKDAYRVKYIDVKSSRIGFLSLVQYEFGVVEGKEEEGYGAAWIGSPDVPGIILEAKRDCDYLLVLSHAGEEHTDAPLPGWRRLYRRLIDWGADAVIASHPHCPQGWETYKSKPIYYSLGDFYFDELTYDDLWYKSIMLEITIGDTIETKEHYVCFDDKTGDVRMDKSDRIQSHIEHANFLLRNNVEYESYIRDLSVNYWQGYKYSLLRGMGGFSFSMRLKLLVRLFGCMALRNKDEMALLNAIQCESHRWLAEMYLRNKQKK